MTYVAVDIGCIECGEKSAVIGVFSTRAAAEAAAEQHEEWQSAHWHGQHSFEVFEVAEMDVPLAVPVVTP